MPITRQAAGNAVFHAATGAPGRLTALGMVVPVGAWITDVARRERLLRRHDLAAALALGGGVHGAAVARQVYFLGPPQRRSASSPPATST